jgi:hypothetical protein
MIISECDRTVMVNSIGRCVVIFFYPSLLLKGIYLRPGRSARPQTNTSLVKRLLRIQIHIPRGIPGGCCPCRWLESRRLHTRT